MHQTSLSSESASRSSNRPPSIGLKDILKVSKDKLIQNTVSSYRSNSKQDDYNNDYGIFVKKQ